MPTETVSIPANADYHAGHSYRGNVMGYFCGTEDDNTGYHRDVENADTSANGDDLAVHPGEDQFQFTTGVGGGLSTCL